MKKLATAVLVLLLICSTAFAQGSYTQNGLFTLTYNDAVYRIDRETYRGSSRSGYDWLFMLYDGSCTVEVTLYSGQDAASGDTVSFVQSRLAAYSPVQRGSYNAGGVTFTLFRTSDSCCAAASVGGRVVCFDLYSSLPDDAAFNTLTGIISGFSAK